MFVMLIGTYFMITYIKKTENRFEEVSFHNNLALSELHVIENSNNLISKDFSMDMNNGISKINGTIENPSEDTLDNLNFIYTLYDSSNNSVYEFEISISNLKAHDSTSFSSVCIVNLSNVVSYSVTLAE